MEPTDHRFVCPSCGQGRVSDRIIEPTPLVCGSHSDAVVSRIRQVTLPETGDNIVVRQESDIGTRSNVAFQGILQSDLLGSQERRRVSPSIRLEIPKSTCLQREIQDDHSQGCVQCIAQRGLGSKHRPQRCLLPCAHTQEVQTPATVRRSRKRRAPSFRIPSSTVRSNFGAKGVYKGNIALRSSRAHACCGSSTVSGRLAAEEPKQDTIGSANKLVGRHHSPGGIPTQRREISTSTHSAIDTHRCRISSRFRSDVSTDGPSSSVRRTDFRPIEPPSIDSLLLAVPPRTTELSNRCDSLREVASQTTTTLHASSLGSCIEEPEGADSCKARSVRPPSEVVARQKVYTGGHVAGHTRRPSEPVHGRFRVRVGSSPGRSPSEWTMVDEGDLAPHQSPGDAGRTECLVSLQGAVDRHDSTTHVRQRIRRLVPKETGRHGVCAALSPSAGSSSPGTRCTDHLAGQTHSGRKECLSRPSLQDEQSGSHRVDSIPIGGRFTVHHMGQAQCGPVCHPDEQQVTRVCIPRGRSIGVGCRRHVDLVERDVCVRISPVRDAGAGTREGTERSPMRDDLNRPQMAQSVLVRQTDGVAGRLSFGPSPEGRPADPTPQPPQTSVTSSSVPSRLEAVQRSLQERGFSQAAAEQISRGRRQSSRAVYDSKWRIFAGWCAEKSVDPFQVTIPQLADFFVYLFQVKRLNPRTIKGYRSAISSTISSHGSTTVLSTSPELSSLIRSFQIERPPQRKIAPQWNLSLVLQALLKPPFEPISRCDLKSLTLKTVFLVALASGRRRSELHALCFDSHHFRQNQDQTLVTLYPALDFVAKNQVLDSVADPVKLKVFTSVGPEDTDRKLCPVRALLQYRKATSAPECRKGVRNCSFPTSPPFVRKLNEPHFRIGLSR